MVLDSRRGKNSTLDGYHLWRNLDAKVFQILVIVVTQDLKALLDNVGSDMRRLASELDHVCGLPFVQLLWAPLALDDRAEFQWKHSHLAGHDTRQHRKLEPDVVGVFEVVLNRSLDLSRCIVAIFLNGELERSLRSRIRCEFGDLECTAGLRAMPSGDSETSNRFFDFLPVDWRCRATEII